MWRLVWKDMMVQRGPVIALVAFVIYLASAGMPTFLVFLFGMLMAVTGVVLRAISKDEENETLALLATLPVSRKEIVMARYVGTVFVMLVSILFSYIVMTIAKGGFIPIGSLFNSIGVPVVIILSLAAVLFPIYYWLGYDAMRYVMTGLIFLAAFLALLTALPMTQLFFRWLEGIGFNLILGIAVLISIVLYFVSMRISMRVLDFTDL
ncbi:ABC-2 transporter permease [Listeria weihenstephanensis]|uniref:ABC-2 transporter permease n=1 Tax=Listeria weihenstephanensis TaxID=1006155 RepID=A0A841Z4R4_9LIST|nr:ABC-2 transporter permease [Listeria weihenstephanensis]MBC1499652.1 ABC-2 transporter permease [Listeria weihenstephanensis]